MTRALALLLLLLAALPGVELVGSPCPARLEAGGHQLALRGGGRLTWRRLVPIYDAALWLAAGHQGDPLADVAKRYEVVYLRGFSAEDCAEATTATFARGLPPAQAERARAGLAALNALYTQVRPGDRFSYTYLPGTGTTLAHNGRDLGTVAGADLAAGLFAIWIGPEAVDQRLRRALLGGG